MLSTTRRPTTLNAAAELPRAMLEASLLSMAWPALLACAKRGAGQPVVVVPGFLGGDDSTLALRRFLTSIGYPAQPWLLGRNRGRPEAVDRLARRFYRLYQVYQKPIVLIGQSLGGVYARELARQLPDAVAAVITLGSPFGAKDADDTNPAVARLFESMSGLSVEDMRAKANDDDPAVAPPMPCTSIFSKSDGVVSWRACLQAESDLAENIEILGSHTGMAMHPVALRVIADRLAQPPDAWRKFDSTFVPGTATVKA